MDARSLAIVIPAYNEHDRLAKTLLSIVQAWGSHAVPGLILERVIVVDDGSSDDTLQIAESFKNQLPMQCMRLPQNKGKGAASRAGVLAASADLVLIYDADGAAPILEVNKLFDELTKNKADIAIGSRVLKSDGAIVTMSWYRRLIGRTYYALSATLLPGISDAACGCKLFTKESAHRLFALQRIDRFAFDVEVLAMALILKYKVVEVPLLWTAIPESKVRIIRDGAQMFWCLLVLHARKMTGKLVA
jgi:glycosyltransferase involved in cell wall biosynthesis